MKIFSAHLFLGLLLLIAPAEAPAVSSPSSAALDNGWLKLLHYQEKQDDYLSIVENAEFFLTANGRSAPTEEYEASITTFNTPNDTKKCDFPARFLYLKKHHAVQGDLSACEEYNKFLSDVQPKAVTMLFTNAYMNNPSSLFGHTLFRIDTERKGTQLLAHGANFGADTGEDAGILYALKGLWGGYYGTFGIKPYYDVINLYNNIENRDIWEYGLNLTQEELKLFTAHMWEMKQAKIRYYFANQNCSYVLLLMLEAIRPELNLSSDFRYSAAPLATLKAVNNVSGLIGETAYRPSRQSKLKHRAAQMNKNQYQTFINIIRKDKTDLSTLTDEEKADVLETAYQYVQYRYVEGELELADYRKKSLSLLRERSKITNHRQYFDELKTGENPLNAHKTRQLGFSAGTHRGDFFEEISFKPAYTSLLEDSYGLLKGAEINLFETKLRHYDPANKYVLQSFNLLEIKSLSGADAMFQPLSYDIFAKVERLFDARTGKDKTALTLGAGAGQSYALTPNTLIYILSSPHAAYSGGLADNGYLGLAFKGGIYHNSGRFRLKLEAIEDFTTSTAARGQTYALTAGYGLTRNLMLYADCKRFHSDNHDDEEISLGIKVNF